MIEAPTDAPPRPPRTLRPIILWTVGILLALALAWFVGAVVVPYFQVRAVAAKAAPLREGGVRIYFGDPDPRIIRLGGPERAAAKLGFYLRLPGWLAPHRNGAVSLLGRCGHSAVPGLIRALKDKDDGVRAEAACALGKIGPEALDAVPALVAALGDSSEDVRAYTTQSLGQIGCDSPEVISALEKLVRKGLGIPHHLAVRALERIRQKHAPPAQQAK